MPTPSPQARLRNNMPQVVISFDERLRYTVPETAGLLKQSVSRTWNDIKNGKLAAIHDGGRTFVPGSEILRRSSLPQESAALMGAAVDAFSGLCAKCGS